MRQLLLIICLLAPLSSRAETQPIGNIDDVRNLTELVMNMVAEGELSKAFNKLKPYWPMPEAEVDVALSQSLDQRGTIARRFGESIGIEFLCLETVGNSLAKIVYLEKFQRHAIIWQFFFYQPSKGWFVNTFVWNDNLPGAFVCDA